MSGTPTGPDDPTVPMGGDADPDGPSPAEERDPWYTRPEIFIPVALLIVLVAVLLVVALGGDEQEIAEDPGETPVDEPAEEEPEPAEPEPEAPDDDAAVDDDDPDTDTDRADPVDPADDEQRDPPAELGEATSTFVVDLSWENEVDDTAEPPAFGQGQEGVTGTAWLWLNADEGIICADIVVQGLDAGDSFESGPGAHLHAGGLEENGPVAVAFATPDDQAGESSGCFTEFEEGFIEIEDSFDPVETLQMVEDNPEDWYVNVHSEAYPMGVVRGQLPDGGQDELPAQ
ncbi:MAG: CHRD domain-containing protein [Egibacteraceae bacterium]